MNNSQNSVFCSEKFRKFYRTLFCNHQYLRLLNGSIKFIELFFSVQKLKTTSKPSTRITLRIPKQESTQPAKQDHPESKKKKRKQPPTLHTNSTHKTLTGTQHYRKIIFKHNSLKTQTPPEPKTTKHFFDPPPTFLTHTQHPHVPKISSHPPHP